MTQSAREYHRLLQECVAQLHDGHTDVSISWPRACLPIWVNPVERKAVITEILAEEKMEFLAPELKQELMMAKLKPGDEITHIGGRPVQEILEQEIYAYISASTPQDRDRRAFAKLLNGEIDSRAALRVRSKDSEPRDVILTRSIYRRKNRPVFEHRSMSNGIEYVSIRSFGSKTIVEEFLSVFDTIQSAKGFIIDVRGNGGGSTDNGYAIISHLIDKPIQGSRWRTRQYMPAFRAWGTPERWYEGQHGAIEPSEGGHFLGPIVVLSDASTVSAAEDFLVALHAGHRATLVGERSAGTTGQPLQVGLPGGTSARICTKRDFYPDGREFVGIGVIPDVEVYPTQADIGSGRDTVLHKGLEVLNKLIGDD